jgi:hypothetical protein
VFRTILARALVLGVLAVGVVSGAAVAATGGPVTVGPSTVSVNPNGYRFAVDVTCPPSAEATPCEGLLSMQTVPIKPYAGFKPYSHIPKKKWPVGALEFSAPAGKTVPVRGRLLAGALVQVKAKGSVKVLVDIVQDGAVVGKTTLTLKLKRG